MCRLAANPSLGDKHSTLYNHSTVTTSGSVLTLSPPVSSNLLSQIDASTMAQFSMELRELDAVSTLSTMNQVPDTQLDTQSLMHETSMDSEVTLRKVLGSAEILPARPGLDPFEDTQPTEWPSDSSSFRLITATSPSVIAAPSCMPPGLALSYNTLGPSSYHTHNPSRSLHLKLVNKRYRYDLRKFSFAPRIVNVWNSLPKIVISADTTDTFKRRLDKFWQH